MFVKGLALAAGVLGIGAQGVAGKSATATFYNLGVQGTITFDQSDADSPVQVQVDLQDLNSGANGYHIHSFPVSTGGSGYTLNSAEAGCGGGITGGHYNPLLVPGGAGNTGTEYACSTTNQAGCEAGDLSGLFGPLQGLDSISETYVSTDSGMTLFGENSIIGRSVVIHKDEDGNPRWVCGTILETNVELKKVVATFEGEVEGTITLLQNAADPLAETSIRVSLAQSSGETVDHKWHVHETAIMTEGDCGSTGGHYNPTLVVGGANVPGTYECNTTNLAGCEIGDMSGKHGKLTLSTSTSQSMYTDASLPLTGPNSVSGRSIVIHVSDAGGARYVCANLGKTAVATFSGEVKGTVSLFQGAQGEKVTVKVDLEDLQGMAGGYHIHSFPTTDGTCGGGVTGGHYNPLLVPGGAGNTGLTYACSPTNLAGCEAGDLSNKFGSLAGLPELDATYESAGAGLDLFGDNSVVGRSIVIHKNEAGNPRWVCANIKETTEQVQRIARLGDDLDGSLVLVSQTKVDAGAETVVYVNAAYASGTNVDANNWHVHSDPVTTDCASTGGHYNPEGINGGAGVTGPTYLCAPNAIGYCEVGDQGKKLGKLDMALINVFTDPKLPLSGIYSVADRSVVVHEPIAAARISCASFEESIGFTSPPTLSPSASPTTLSPSASPTPLPVTEESSSNGGTAILAASIGGSIGGALVFALVCYLICGAKASAAQSAETAQVASKV